MLFLNTQFKQNPDIQRTYLTPKLCSERQASHMIHVAHHQTALDYMCNHHINDMDVGIMPVGLFGAAPLVVLPPNFQIRNMPGVPFAYYHVASKNGGPQVATWARPIAAHRMNFTHLFDWLRDASHEASSRPVAQSLRQTYDICQGCNALMTQKSHFRFILGLRNAGAKNNRGIILPGSCLNQYEARTGSVPLERAYGRWHVANIPHMRASPLLAKTDSESPCIAYYLHMCLPIQVSPYHDPFLPINVRVRVSARGVFLQLCWIILEIACLATLLREGTVTKPRNQKRSHGMHQHKGVLDLYVSFFFWRMIQFESGQFINHGNLDFVQWHQKYYSDITNCPGFLSRPDASGIIGRLMFGNTDVSGKALLRQIQTRLVNFYTHDLWPLRLLITGMIPIPGLIHAPGLAAVVSEYFLPLQVARVLAYRSLEVRACVLLFLFYFFLTGRDRPLATTSNRRWASSGSARFYSVSWTCARVTRGNS